MKTYELLDEQLAAGCVCVVHTTLITVESRLWLEPTEPYGRCFWLATLFVHMLKACPWVGAVTFTEVLDSDPSDVQCCATCASVDMALGQVTIRGETFRIERIGHLD